MRLSIATSVILTTESLVVAIPHFTEGKDRPIHPQHVHHTVQRGAVFSGHVDRNVSNHNKRAKEIMSRWHPEGGSLSRDNASSFELKNRRQDERTVECNPQISLSNADVLGILNCGVGSYCIESNDSSLGGVCSPASRSTTRTKGGSSNLPSRQRRRLGRRRRRRRREQVAGRLTIFEIADLFCNAETPNVNYTVSCECEVDFDAYTGQFACYLGPDCVDIATGCEGDDDGADEDDNPSIEFKMCSTELLTAFMTNRTSYVYTSCYTQEMPKSDYSFTYCIDFGNTPADGPTCSIQVQGVTCDSCKIDIGGGATEGENCEVFDCTNTPIKYAGDRCGSFSYPALRAASVVEYLYTEIWGSTEACSPKACNLCGENGGRMTKPDAYFTYESDSLTTETKFTCSEINYDALTGRLVDLDYCQTLSALAVEPCGCVNDDGSDSDPDNGNPTDDNDADDEPSPSPTDDGDNDENEPPSNAPSSNEPPSNAPPSPGDPPTDQDDFFTPSTEAPVGSGATGTMGIGTWGRRSDHQQLAWNIAAILMAACALFWVQGKFGMCT